MGKQQNLTDPVSSKKEDKDLSSQVKTATPVKSPEKSVNLSGISKEDLGSVSMAQTRTSHPFAGYPYPKGKRATMVVAYLKPVAQDPSGSGYSVREDIDWDEYLEDGPYKGKTLNEVLRIDPKYAKDLAKMGKRRTVNLETTHSRMIHNFETDRNEDVVFDRTIEVEDGDIPHCAEVPSHNVRAQLIFDIDPRTGLIKPNPDYGLLDRAQAPRLLRIVQSIARPLRVSQQLVDVVEGARDEIPREHLDLAEEA